ncbi:hypothetical protein PR202_gb19607 [Eleusine coracana subsp. coracana]|uniref:J domain-containing protein n=1 Tax=Eleusine coracana subsp. coracana TaxID=191504 RepID=A0AAV5F9B6_ELECO|nr:hypothetical protein PR202_gb19607 [Eleusine coracana subsp. coracana]
MAVSSPSSAPEKKRKWLLSNRKVIDKYLREARAILAAAPEAGGGDAVAALGLVDAALELSPRMEAALELRARALLSLRRYKEVAEMLRDYIPSCGKSCAGDDASSSSSSSTACLLSSGSGDLGTISRAKLLSPERHRSDDAGEPGAGSVRSFRCFDISELTRRVLAGLSKNPNTDTQWRYLVLGQACFHLGLIEDAMVLLQTGRRLASAAFRRESVCWSDDSFSSSSTASATSAPPSSKTSKSGSSAFIIPATESESVSNLLAHVKLLLRRRAAAMAALDAGLPAESVRHFSKILDARRGVLPHPFAAACLVGRAAAHQAGGRPADAIADCNRALALDPAYIPALRATGRSAPLLYDAALRDGKLPGPPWRPQGGVRYREIAGAHRKLVARIQGLRARVAAGEACNVDYYLLLGVRRGCTRSELERAHLLLSLKLKPDRAVVFGERLELVDEHRDIEAVRDQARMSALLLYRLLQKGYSFIMSAVLDEEAAERQRAKEAAEAAAAAALAAKQEAAAALAAKQEAAAAAAAAKQEAAKQELLQPPSPVVPEKPKKTTTPTSSRPRSPPGRVQKASKKPKAKAATSAPTTMSKAPVAAAAAISKAPAAAAAVTSTAPVYQGVFCRDMAVVGTLLSRGGGFDRAIPVKCEAMSC